MESMKTSPATGTTPAREWSGALELPRYYARQLITPDEMNLEVRYYRDMMRRHNRMLHGWGVVAGAQVSTVMKKDASAAEPYMLHLSPGYILGPYGDEIVILSERRFDVRAGSMTGCSTDVTTDMGDAWCTTVTVQKIPDTFYVAVRYKEILSRQVRVQPAACGCDETPCEYSRICDGYEVGIRKDCADAGEGIEDASDLMEALFRSDADHPGEISGSPVNGWVTLAKVTLDPNGTVISIDNCSCRRTVATFAAVWGKCDICMVKVDKIEHDLQQDAEGKIYLVGANLNHRLEIGFDHKGITLLEEPLSNSEGTELGLVVKVEPDVSEGEHEVRISAEDCGMVTVKVIVKPKS